MKKYFFAMLTMAAALGGCSEDEVLTNEVPQPGGAGTNEVVEPMVFTATMEGAPETRATYDATNKCASWETTDQISINGKTYNAQSAGLTTTFKAATEGQEAEGETYNAYFACTYDGTTATLPSAVSETWTDGKFNMPMYATSTTTNLEFKNLCGVLKVIVKNSQMARVKHITVSSSNHAMSGAFAVDANNAAILLNPTETSLTKTVNYTNAVETSAEGTVFYVAIPAQTYQDLTIVVSDGTDCKDMVTKSGRDIVVERNKIYPVTFEDNTPYSGFGIAVIDDVEVDVPWVQLWAGGPKFAEFNVGVTDGKAESLGGYYCWGGSIDQDPSYACKSGTGPLTGTDDTATNLWGDNWRMPTKAEFEALLNSDNCDVKWTTVNNVNGRKFTGKGNYSSNSVFLPAAGACYYGNVSEQGYYGFYWSSTPDGGYCAYYLYFINSGNQNVSYAYRGYGYSVRAVLAEE